MPDKLIDLRWFLDFMGADLDSAAPEDLAKWAVGLGMRTAGMPIAGPDARRLGDRPLGDRLAEVHAEVDLYDYGEDGAGRLRVIRLQRHLKDWFTEFMVTVQKLATNGVPVAEIDLGDTKLKGPLSEFVLAQTKKLITTSAYITLNSLQNKNKERDLHLDFHKRLMESPIKVWESAGDEEETLTYHFLRSLHGAKLSQIKLCPECGQYFLHTTKRDKIFCSNLCAARKGARDRRAKMKEDAPDKYQEILKQNKERAHKSYVKKVQEKHPKAKVERRPRNPEVDQED